MTYLFTHNDLDGVGCAVIAHLAFPSWLSVKYCSYKTIKETPHSIQSPRNMVK